MDDRSLRALLAKGERSGVRPGPSRLWATAALLLTVVGGYLGTLLLRADTMGPLPKILAFVASTIFGSAALYCWYRLLRA